MNYSLLLYPTIALFVSILFPGCNTEADEEGTFETETRNGISIVSNADRPVWTDVSEAPIGFELEQTFGTESEPEEALLSSTSSVVVDESGTVYVLDRSEHRVLAFNADGTLKWSAGRQGEGPGELNFPTHLLLRDDGHLLISHRQGSAIAVWDQDGAFVEQLDVSRIEGYVAPTLVFLDGGRLGFIARDDKNFDWFLVNASLPDLEILSEKAIDFELSGRPGISVLPQVSYIDETLYVAQQDRYAVQGFTAEGERRKEIRRPDIGDLLGQGMYNPDGVLRIRTYSELSIPLIFPDGSSLIASYWSPDVDDPDETLRRAVDGEDVDISFNAALDLYEASGRLLGRLQWNDARKPDVGRPMIVGPNGKLYSATDDPFPQVRRYAVHFE